MSRWLSWLLAGLIVGCASAPCKPTVCPSEAVSPNSQTVETAPLVPNADETPSPTSSVQMVCGRPNKFLDCTGRVLGAPRRLLLWNRRVNNHCISPATEEIVAEYLTANGLPEVLVRVNEYAPLAEWNRLKNNRRVGAGWRYTVGVFDLVQYTLMPGRLFGGDWYNPFTDTINLYSDVPAIALHEAAYAKNIHNRRRPGTYAVVQHFPIVGMWYRTNATREALEYLEEHGSGAAESQEADRVLFPMYGGAAGGQIGQFVPLPFVGTALTLAGTGVGHIVGRFRAHQNQPKEQKVESPPWPDNGYQTILPTTATAATTESPLPAEPRP